MTARTIDESVWDLLHLALDLFRDDRVATNRLRHHLSRFEEPLRIAIAGPAESGKSTLVNALMGEEIAPIELDAGRDHAFTWYEDGPAPRVTAYQAGGPARELAVTRSAGGMRVDSGGWRLEQVDDIVVEWPTRALRHATLVDTPPVTSPSPAEKSTLDRVLADTDAVMYLTPDVRGADLDLLRQAQPGSVARAAPVNVMLVLSRADELSGGRIDALVTAKQLARAHHREARISQTCLSVIALSGLVALASRVLSEPEFAALAMMAAAERADLERHLVSTDRFTGPMFPVPIEAHSRRALLDRFGIHGVRLATTLIRTGSGTRARLAAELMRRSGLAELRESMNQHFIERRHVLKARSALVAVESMLRAEPRPGAGEMLARVEQIVGTSHEFQEMRLLAKLRSSGMGYESDLLTEAHRLIGGNGTSLPARLGIEHDAGEFELWTLGTEALQRWQNLAEDHRLSLRQRRAGRVVVRSCEGLLAAIPQPRQIAAAPGIDSVWD